MRDWRNNGDTVSRPFGSHPAGGVARDQPNHTTEVVLEIDHTDGQVVRQFGHLPWCRGSGHGTLRRRSPSPAVGKYDAQLLHNYGSGARVRGATPDGDVVWEARWGGSKLLGRTVWLEDLYDFAP